MSDKIPADLLDPDSIGPGFPTKDPETWNDGQWPPPEEAGRWKQLFLAALTGTAGQPHLDVAIVRHAVGIADWALRMELIRTR